MISGAKTWTPPDDPFASSGGAAPHINMTFTTTEIAAPKAGSPSVNHGAR